MHVAALIMQRDAAAERENARAALARADSELTLCSPTSPRSKTPALEKLDEDPPARAEPVPQDFAAPNRPASPTPTLSPLQRTETLSRVETHPGPFPDLQLATIPTRLEEDTYGPPPDGGRDAWLAVLSGALLFFTMFGFVTSFGQLKGYYLAHQLAAYSQPTVAWIATIQSTLTFFPSLFFGRLFDAHGPRLLVVAGTTLSFASLVAVAFCSEYYQFLLAHALFGFATSIIWGPSASVCGHWFARRRSTAIGIVGCGSGIGGIVYPILLKGLLDRFAFRDAILIVAGMNGALMLPSWFWLRARLPPRQPAPWSALARPWHSRAFLFLALGAGLSMLNMFTPYFDAPTMAAGNRLSPAIRDYAIAILQAGSFLGRASSGFIADRFGAWRVYVALALLTSAVLFAFWCATPMPAAAAVIGLWGYGFASGAWITLVSAVTAAIAPPEELGTWIGVLWTAISPPILAGPVVSGVLIEKGGGAFTYAGVFCGATYLVGTGVTALPFVFGRRGVEQDVEKPEVEHVEEK
jgi:MFS family permease